MAIFEVAICALPLPRRGRGSPRRKPEFSTGSTLRGGSDKKAGTSAAMTLGEGGCYGGGPTTVAWDVLSCGGRRRGVADSLRSVLWW